MGNQKANSKKGRKRKFNSISPHLRKKMKENFVKQPVSVAKFIVLIIALQSLFYAKFCNTIKIPNHKLK